MRKSKDHLNSLKIRCADLVVHSNLHTSSSWAPSRLPDVSHAPFQSNLAIQQSATPYLSEEGEERSHVVASAQHWQRDHGGSPLPVEDPAIWVYCRILHRQRPTHPFHSTPSYAHHLEEARPSYIAVRAGSLAGPHRRRLNTIDVMTQHRQPSRHPHLGLARLHFGH